MGRLQEAVLVREREYTQRAKIKTALQQELLGHKVLDILEERINAVWGGAFYGFVPELTYHGPSRGVYSVRVTGYDQEGEKSVSFGYHMDGSQRELVVSGNGEVLRGSIPRDPNEKEKVIGSAVDGALLNPFRPPVKVPFED